MIRETFSPNDETKKERLSGDIIFFFLPKERKINKKMGNVDRTKKRVKRETEGPPNIRAALIGRPRDKTLSPSSITLLFSPYPNKDYLTIKTHKFP